LSGLLALLEAGSNVVNGIAQRAFAYRPNPFNRAENQSLWEITDFFVGNGCSLFQPLIA